MTAAGVVLEARELGLPDGSDTLALARPDPTVFDRIAHEHPAVEDGEPFDLQAMGPELLAACAVAPTLTVEECRDLLTWWPHGDAQAVLEHCLTLCLPTAVDRAWWRLERDQRLRAEMDYCGTHGLPHSQFLGGMPIWTEHDRELALAWDLRRRLTHPGCGTRPDEWDADPEAYIPDVRGRDKGCEVIAMTEAQLSEEAKTAGEHVVLVPRAQFEVLEAQREAESERLEQVKADRAARRAEAAG